MDLHQLGQERSRQVHRILASRIGQDLSIVAQARTTLARWVVDNRIHREYASKWALLLEAPTNQLVEVMTSDSQEAKDLRQVSPFAGCMDPRERWKVWKEAKGA